MTVMIGKMKYIEESKKKNSFSSVDVLKYLALDFTGE